MRGHRIMAITSAAKLTVLLFDFTISSCYRIFLICFVSSRHVISTLLFIGLLFLAAICLLGSCVSEKVTETQFNH